MRKKTCGQVKSRTIRGLYKTNLSGSNSDVGSHPLHSKYYLNWLFGRNVITSVI